MLHQPELIRKYILRKLGYDLRIYISMLPTTEMDALKVLQGKDAVQTLARWCDDILTDLGHITPSTDPVTQRSNGSTRAARQVVVK